MDAKEQKIHSITLYLLAVFQHTISERGSFFIVSTISDDKMSVLPNLNVRSNSCRGYRESGREFILILGLKTFLHVFSILA